jgi:hypothetical protein
VLKSSGAISCVNVELRYLCLHHQGRYVATLRREETSGTLGFNTTLTLLMAREDFSTFVRRESFKSYIKDIKQKRYKFYARV